MKIDIIVQMSVIAIALNDALTQAIETYLPLAALFASTLLVFLQSHNPWLWAIVWEPYLFWKLVMCFRPPVPPVMETAASFLLFVPIFCYPVLVSAAFFLAWGLSAF
ncbi:MAG: hypothetical protein ACYCOU_03890 [Sulfobacillus sp.]